jgi:GNAT superfamily N-acetyltransferase
MNHLPDAVRRHLEAWFGGWPTATSGIAVVESDVRNRPGWDGNMLPVVGVTHNDFAVLSVAPGQASVVMDRLKGTDPSDLADTLGLMVGSFRWNLTAPLGDDVGEWVATADKRVPSWLKPFNGDVLIQWDDQGHYGAGVGRKMHNALGHEISVGTEESLRGRGIARRLVATAARRILADGAVPTYVHLLDNHASAKVAEAAGFADLGWRYVGTPEVT